MLSVYIESLLTRTASHGARALGYARETAALEARHARLEEAWSSHICAIQTTLLTAALEAENAGGVALVIGGGVAQDLSFSDLLSCFAEIWLLDIAFSRQTRARIRQWPGRIRCVPLDVTGVVDSVWRSGRIPFGAEIPRQFPLERPAGLSWIASVNCWPQLPLLPATWLLAHGADEDETERFGQALITAHIEQLSAWDVPVCLITEMGDRRLDRRGQPLESTDYRPLLLPALESQQAALLAEWDWLAQPRGELPDGESEIHAMTAWQWNRRLSSTTPTGFTRIEQ